MSVGDWRMRQSMRREEDAQRWGPAYQPLCDALAAVDQAAKRLEDARQAGADVVPGALEGVRTAVEAKLQEMKAQVLNR